MSRVDWAAATAEKAVAMNLFNLSGKVAVVTGGNGGLRRATGTKSGQMGAHGWQVKVATLQLTILTL